MTPEQESRILLHLQELLGKHKEHSDDNLKMTVAEIRSDIAAAFPDGDAKAHCEYHREIMEQIKARKEFWQKMRYEIYRYGLIGFCIWLVAQLAHSVGFDFWKLWDKFGGVVK